MKKNDINLEVLDAQYMPLSSLQRALDLLETPVKEHDKRCKRNLALLQTNKSVYQGEKRQLKWRNLYQMALRRAIYSHNWDRVAYLLIKSPIWEHASNLSDELPLYIRALTILLMYHPSAKKQSLLDSYIHLVLACRTHEDKKTIYKILVSLTGKIYGRPQIG